ncbi:MAG TPA: hypothetical protein VKB34_02890 [Povalibacter sp.]|nr:hypothetical protein [Povalibacter sp.]
MTDGTTPVFSTSLHPLSTFPGSPYATFVVHGPIGLALPRAAKAPVRPRTPAPLPQPVARLAGLTVMRGAQRRSPNENVFLSTQIKNQDIIVRARTEPDHWSVWTHIVWQCDGGRQITGSPNGWAIPRADLRTYHISASLGHTHANLTIFVVKRQAGKLVSAQGTPIKPRGGGRMINIYGEGETDSVKFEDYALEKQYQVAHYNHRKLRPLSREPVTSKPPDGPGLPDHCASDICMRSTLLADITIAEIRRIAGPGCRFTYANNVESTYPQDVLNEFREAREIEVCEPHSTFIAVVIEFP